MNIITQQVKKISSKARNNRAEIFKKFFKIDENTKILDLGSENGSNIKKVLEGTLAKASNIYIADIDEELIKQGEKKYGFNGIVIDESGKLPFNDNFFDIVFCSSVIEHVTIPKEEIWHNLSGKNFKSRSLKRQNEFAQEVCRLGKAYFVQTPYKYFPVESHTWLPFISFLPRWMIVYVIKFTNTFWVKKTTPDWYLLNKKEFQSLFPEAKIVDEKFMYFTKSIMAIKPNVTI